MPCMGSTGSTFTEPTAQKVYSRLKTNLSCTIGNTQRKGNLSGKAFVSYKHIHYNMASEKQSSKLMKKRDIIMGKVFSL